MDRIVNKFKAEIRNKVIRLERKIKNGFALGALVAIAAVMCLPILMLAGGSLQSSDELWRNLGQAGAERLMRFDFLPQYPTLKHYLELFFDRPEYYAVFFNSLKIVCATLVGQMLFGIPAAWAFARFEFPGKRILFTFYIILMMMPFSVTMLSSYLILNRLSLLDNLWGIILPGVFSTFPVFIMYRSFCALPEGLVEAAQIDGAGELQIFWHIGLPLGADGIGSALVLGFLEYFSLIEQPLAFLKEKSLWPLSLYLPEIGLSQAGYAFAASTVALVLAVIVFALGREYLEKGIIATGMKE